MKQKKNNTGPFIVPVFIPQDGCPHQCAFCNQPAITNQSRESLSIDAMESMVWDHLKFRGKNRKQAQLAFYGGNFLGLEKTRMTALLNSAERFVASGDIDSIRFSTRPDTITKETIAAIGDFSVSTIELGVQSMDDKVLAVSRRGHSSAETARAVAMLKKNRQYRLGLQMMVGLPGDDNETAMETGRRICDMEPDFVRIYPALVLKGSLLSKWWEKGEYSPLGLDNAVTLVKKLYSLFTEKGIRVIRMGLQASESLDDGVQVLAGPYHPAFGHLVFSELFLDRAMEKIEALKINKKGIRIRVHPRSISRMRGLKNMNINILQDRFSPDPIQVKADRSLDLDQVMVDGLT